jgi:plastocyanin
MDREPPGRSRCTRVTKILPESQEAPMRRRSMVAVVLGVVLGAFWPSAPATAGGGGCHDQTLVDEKADQVKMADSCFYPTVARVEPGTEVTWFNGDHVVHMVSGLGWGAPGEVGLSGRTSFTFDEPGVFPYSCPIHPGMIGAVVVGDGVASAAGTGVSGGGVAAAPLPQTSDRIPEEGGVNVIPILVLGALAVAAAGVWAVARRRRTPRRDPVGGAAA